MTTNYKSSLIKNPLPQHDNTYVVKKITSARIQTWDLPILQDEYLNQLDVPPTYIRVYIRLFVINCCVKRITNLSFSYREVPDSNPD